MNKRVVKVLPYGASELKRITISGSTFSAHAFAGNTMSFQFPEGIIDLSTLTFLFKYARLGGPSNDTVPRDTECLIDELEVCLGDTVVNKIQNHQQLYWLISTYGRPADWQVSGTTWRRLWTNRRIETANVINWPFAMDSFLGFLGSGATIDTRKMGRLTVRMRLADNATVSSSTAANSWGMNDAFFRVTYLPDTFQGATERVQFDDYTSMRMAFPGYDTRNTLIVDGRKRLDWVAARLVNVFNHDQKATGFDAGVGLTPRFVATGANVAHWDFLVNGTPLHTYKPVGHEEGIAAMSEVFPNGAVNVVSANAIPENLISRPWACGARLDLPQREDDGQHEIAFETQAASGAGAFPCYSWVYVKSTSVLEAGGVLSV